MRARAYCISFTCYVITIVPYYALIVFLSLHATAVIPDVFNYSLIHLTSVINVKTLLTVSSY